ncbi:MAG: RIP metalloprotease RseP [Clostridia bacterium]|nr:RIP metalloprotease RseP [Clostridia bacterium]
MTTILYVVIAIAVLLLMVLIHEFGHYVVGRMLKFKITEFSIGFGKALFSRKNKRGEVISLRLFPLGGFCAFEGEDEDKPNNPDAFNNQAPWKRILVFLAGVTFNFATAVIFSIILLCSIGYDIQQVKGLTEVDTTKIEQYVEGSFSDLYEVVPEAERLHEGDIIVAIDGKKIDFAFGTTYKEQLDKAAEKVEDFISKQTDGLEGAELQKASREAFPYSNVYTTATVKRGGEYQEVTFALYRYETYAMKDGKKVPMIDEDTKQIIKDENGDTVFQIYTHYGWNSKIKIGSYVHTFGEAVERAVPFSFGLGWVVLESLWQMVTFQLPISEIGGPVTTISFIASNTRANPLTLLILIPLISANLAIFNALPIPALDGSHVIFTLIEWIRKKPVKRETENLIHTIGLFILFGAVILIDILHFLL